MAKRDEISRILIIDDTTPTNQLERVMKALDSLNRLRILRYLSNKVASVSEILRHNRNTKNY